MTVTVVSTTDTEKEVEEAVVSKPSTFELKPDSVDPAETAEPATIEEAPLEAAVESEEEASREDAEPEPDVEAGAEDAPSDEAEPVKRKKRRRGRSYKERASQLAREKAEETQRANELATKVAELEAAAKRPIEAPAAPDPQPVDAAPTPEAPEKTSAPTPEAVTAKPKAEAFETYEEYQEALVDWKVQEQVDRRLQTHETQQRDRIARDRVQRAQDELVAAHTARIDAFRSEHGDFDAVIDEGKHLPMTRPMQDAVLNSDTGPALMYHLCKNPDECDRIASMHPVLALKEMGRLEARLEVAPTGPTSVTEPQTKAPRPIKPVGGGATASTIPLDQMSYQDYKRARMKQERAETGG